MLRRWAGKLIYSDAVQRTNTGYRFALWRRHGVGRPNGQPDAPWSNAVLGTEAEIEAASAQVTALGLHPHPTPSKNWDSLGMLAAVLRSVPMSGVILDAGATSYSVLLRWLFLYGYRNLHGLNVDFDAGWREGPIQYQPGDLTRTRFAEGTFDAVLCQSVLEHGVDVQAYLREAARILKPGGLLLTSVDYFSDPIDTQGVIADGHPYRIFSKADVSSLLVLARQVDLSLTGPLELSCLERPIRYFGQRYTFLLFTLQKGSARTAGPGA